MRLKEAARCIGSLGSYNQTKTTRQLFNEACKKNEKGPKTRSVSVVAPRSETESVNHKPRRSKSSDRTTKTDKNSRRDPTTTREMRANRKEIAEVYNTVKKEHKLGFQV